jgi:hypothetical protein
MRFNGRDCLLPLRHGRAPWAGRHPAQQLKNLEDLGNWRRVLKNHTNIARDFAVSMSQRPHRILNGHEWKNVADRELLRMCSSFAFVDCDPSN